MDQNTGLPLSLGIVVAGAILGALILFGLVILGVLTMPVA